MLHRCLEAPPETERVWGGLCNLGEFKNGNRNGFGVYLWYNDATHTQFNDFPNYNKKGMKIWFFAK